VYGISLPRRGPSYKEAVVAGIDELRRELSLASEQLAPSGSTPCRFYLGSKIYAGLRMGEAAPCRDDARGSAPRTAQPRQHFEAEMRLVARAVADGLRASAAGPACSGGMGAAGRCRVGHAGRAVNTDGGERPIAAAIRKAAVEDAGPRQGNEAFCEESLILGFDVAVFHHHESRRWSL